MKKYNYDIESSIEILLNHVDTRDESANILDALEETMIRRKEELLKACYDLMQKQNNSGIVLNLLEETVHYDDTDCDGYCLMDDIKNEIQIE